MRHLARPAALYAVLAVALVAPALVPGRTLSASDYLWTGAPWQASRPAGVTGLGSNYEQADAVLVFQPFMQYERSALPGVPLWNPYIMGGRPFVANAQSALFSPFTWPVLLLPFWWALGVSAALKVFCAALGAHALARALGARLPGALLAGVAFGFSLAFVAWLAWPLSSVWAWLPWLLLAAWEVARRPGALGVAALAAVVALQFFGGHPESSFHSLVVAGLFGLLALSRVPAGARGRGVGRLVVGVAAGTALAAVALVPFLELLAHSGDLANRQGQPFATLDKRFILGFAMPDYWGRPSGAQIAGFEVARACYVGALPLMLAAWSLLRPTRERVAVAVTGAVALAVVLGAPVAKQVAEALPGFNQAYNTRLVIVTALALALLAGWGLDDLVRRVERPRLLVAGAAAILVVPVLAVLAAHPSARLGDALRVAWGFAAPPPLPAATDVLPYAALFVWVVLAGAAVALLVLRATGRLSGGRFAALAVGLLVLDLFRIDMGNNPSIPVAHADPPATPAIARLRADRPARFAGLQGKFGLQPLVPDLAMRYGLYDARGYDYPVERRYDRLWRRAVSGDTGFTPPTLQIRTDPLALRTLGLLGVKDIIAAPGGKPVPGLRVTYDGPDARLYGNPDALPRAWVVAGQQRVAGEDAALAAITAPGFDARRAAVVEQPVPGLSAGPAQPAGSARIASYAPEHVVLTARAARPALVVLSDVQYPGWHATVDGREAPIERVDYLLRGIPVGRGAHRIVLEYRPLSWRIGWIVSLLALLGLGAAVWQSARRWPARSSAP